MKDLTVAAVCMRSIPGAVKENFNRLRKLAGKAAAGGADIACFPECTLTGYVLSPTEGFPGEWQAKTFAPRLVLLARETNLILIVGFIETRPGKKPYITQVVAGPAGLLGYYRKTHLSPAEAAIYRPGKTLEMFQVKQGIFGLQLCYEAHFPELSTAMALRGADLIFIPHASPRGTAEEKLESWLRHLPARAFDNALFVIACNQVGKTDKGLAFPGVALALGPDGRILDTYTGDREGMLFVSLDANFLETFRGHRMKYFLPRRRPELYG
ncbi:MAG: nitrilase-related carbon-nitrogen hydrolase [Desulfatiglandaceae bacterium]